MIWINGEISIADRLSIDLADRIFEHGLGLFETFRTWDGKALLFAQHIDRMKRSGEMLGIGLGKTFPTIENVHTLVKASGMAECQVRLTASAGRSSILKPIAWMTVSPLPHGSPDTPYRVVDASWTVAANDPLARHKTLNYWSKRIAFEEAHALGADEGVFSSADGRFWEGSRTNLFVVLGGDLLTPPRSGPIVPGIMRQVVIDEATSGGVRVLETDVERGMINSASEIFLTNSVRGLIPVENWSGRDYRPIDPNFPVTSSLRELVSTRLTSLSDL